jgi:hypothetical protein
MPKKHYDLMLDEEALDALDLWLQAAGMTRSGFVNTLIVKTVDAMELKQIPDYKNLSISQLFKMVGGIGKLMKGTK